MAGLDDGWGGANRLSFFAPRPLPPGRQGAVLLPDIPAPFATPARPPPRPSHHDRDRCVASLVNGVVRTALSDLPSGRVRRHGPAGRGGGSGLQSPRPPGLRPIRTSCLVSRGGRRVIPACIQPFAPDAPYRDRRAAGHGCRSGHALFWLLLFTTCLPHPVRLNTSQARTPACRLAADTPDYGVPRAGQATMVATQSLRDELRAARFRNIRPGRAGRRPSTCSSPSRASMDAGGPGAAPGRLRLSGAVEKNIGAFLDLDLPGSKVVVGGGPMPASLKCDYPGVHSTGARHGEASARAYAGSDVSSSPASPTRSGWRPNCSPRNCRSRRFRSPGRRTC